MTNLRLGCKLLWMQNSGWGGPKLKFVPSWRELSGLAETSIWQHFWQHSDHKQVFFFDFFGQIESDEKRKKPRYLGVFRIISKLFGNRFPALHTRPVIGSNPIAATKKWPPKPLGGHFLYRIGFERVWKWIGLQWSPRATPCASPQARLRIQSPLSLQTAGFESNRRHPCGKRYRTPLIG